jgi:4-hydroxy-tetrahydrodipicolinate synthase
MAAPRTFRGSITALVTPMFEDGRINEGAFRDHVSWQIEQGTHGLVPVGTTGESPTLSHDEHKRIVEICIAEAAGRVPVMAGAGSNNTAEAIDFSQHAEQAGADALLIVTPYYNKPSQEGMYQHFGAIARSTKLPIYIYNIPGRSVIDMMPETMARLHNDFENIVGTKDATGNLNRATQQRVACGEGFVQLTGDDGTALGFMAHGGVGCISVSSNIAPRLCADFQNACLAGDFAKARVLHDRLMGLHLNLFVEPNPGPAKYVLSLLGRMESHVRLPLVPLSDSAKLVVRETLERAGLL